MKVLAIIPARGGSKGVPKKNIKLLGDKPLIVHAIDCAKNSNKVTKVVVSSDSDEIIQIVSQNNCQVIKRPEELAEDTSNVITAVEHVYKQLDEVFDIIVLLQPTSPLRTSNDLDKIISMFEDDEKLDGVISVVPFDDYHPARMYSLDEDLKMNSLQKDGETTRRQDLRSVYYRNGCFYAVRTNVFFTEKSFMVQNKKAYVMNPDWLLNIDTQRDFKIAEVLYEDWKNEITNH